MPAWTQEQAHRHSESLRRELGAVILDALQNEDVTEILLNADGQLWLDTHSGGLATTGSSLDAIQAQGLISTIAGLLGRTVGEEAPILEAELPLDGSRFEALLPPVVEAPIFSIRKRAERVIPLKAYLEAGSIQIKEAEALRTAIRERRNVLVSGGPGSGKTTFVNALLGEVSRLAPEQRLCLLEDTYELRCETPNHVSLHTTPSVDLRQLVRASLRLRPDRIVVGEVRGAEAHELLKAWNTGNPGGCATVHANSAQDALERLDLLAQEAGVPSQGRLIASTVHLVAHFERSGSRRRLAELVAVRGFDAHRGFETQPLQEVR